MMLSLDNVLAAHGIPALAGGLAPNFGTGADGAFAPSGGVGPQSATFIWNTTMYQKAGVTTPNGGSSVATNANMLLAIECDKVNGYVGGTTGTSIFTASIGGAVSYVTGTASDSVGSSIQITNNSVEVTKIGVFLNTNANVTLYVWDNNGNQLASANMTSTNTGTWTYFVLSSPLTLAAGTYWVGVYSTTALSVGYISNASAMTNTGTLTNYNIVTFTAPSKDGGPVVKNFTIINIPKYCIVTVDKRCKGLIMLCQGNVTIDGTISMDYMGAIADPTTPGSGYASIDKGNQLYVPNGANNKIIVIGPGGAGGDGGAGGGYYQTSNATNTTANVGDGYTGSSGGRGTSGTWWGGGSGGGGGGGMAANLNMGSNSTVSGTVYGGNGGNGAFLTGGAGGAGLSAGYSANTYIAGNNGGACSGGGGALGDTVVSGSSSSYSIQSGAGGSQGDSAGGAGGGGAGCITYNSTVAQSAPVPAGGAGSAPSQGQGAGGLILIVAQGNVTLGSTSSLTARGTNGAQGGNGTFSGGVSTFGTYVATGGGGGGGAGGGIISVLYKGTLSNSGSTNVNGGSGGSGGSSSGFIYPNGSGCLAFSNHNGQPGKNGTVQFAQI